MRQPRSPKAVAVALVVALPLVLLGLWADRAELWVYFILPLLAPAALLALWGLKRRPRLAI